MTTTNVLQLKFNKLSENQYEATTPVDGEFYITPCPTYALDSEAVHKTGNETINGVKTFNNNLNINFSGNQINLKALNMDISTTPTSNQYSGIQLNDKNGNRIGKLEATQSTDGTWRFGINALRTIDGTNTYSSIQLWTDASRGVNFSFPKCTSKATTTSSATANRVAVITQNYKSGSNWYRVWSDGWIEQGGRASLNERSSTAYTLHRPFSDTNYFVAASQYNVSTTEDAEMGIGCSPTSTTQFNAFCHYINPNTMKFMWYACGY